MNRYHTHPKVSLNILLMLALWCVSIFGTALFTCFIPLTQQRTSEQKVWVELNHHQVKWLDESELLIDGFLYDVAEGEQGDNNIAVQLDRSEQAAFQYLSQIQQEESSQSSDTPSKYKQTDFFPDLFFESEPQSQCLSFISHHFYSKAISPLCKGFGTIPFSPPEAV